MITTDLDPAARVAELRRAFDQSFAVARRPPQAAQADLLLVRIGGRRYGVRIAELRGLHAGRKVRPLPSTASPLLGIVGIRGQLVPVYRLATLLEDGEEHGECRWLVTCGALDSMIALAFDGFEGSTRIPESDLHPIERSAGLSSHARQIARLPSETRYVISIDSILTSLALWTET